MQININEDYTLKNDKKTATKTIYSKTIIALTIIITSLCKSLNVFKVCNNEDD